MRDVMSFRNFEPAAAAKPRELLGLADDDRLVHFVDATAKPPEEAGAATRAGPRSGARASGTSTSTARTRAPARSPSGL